MNWFTVFHIVGLLLLFTAGMLLVPLGTSLVYGEGDWLALLITLGLCTGIGAPLWTAFHKHRDFRRKDGFLIVVGGWLIISLISALPFVIHGSIPSYTDAFFETMSGFTTTGATILNDIESLPHGLLMWRGLMHFFGGMGIVVLMLLIIPMLGIGNVQLFRAESGPGQSSSGWMAPRLKETLRWLWVSYLVLCVAATGLYWLGGMSWFDAINHGMSAVATGGYSTKNASIGFYDSAFIDTVSIVFMWLGGVNFVLYFYLFNGRWQDVLGNVELRFYFGIVVGLCLLVFAILWQSNTYSTPGEALRYGTFHVVSILTTTGFTADDYELWPHSAQYFIFVCMFFGACAGSTTSGLRIIHLVVLLKFLSSLSRRLLQPLVVHPVCLQDEPVEGEVMNNILTLFVMNLMFVLVGTLVLPVLTDIDWFDGFITVIACAWNIGPGFGEVGPASNFSGISDAGKWFLSFCMLAGRMDMFTVLVLFHPAFWKK